ncbi:TAP46-like protein [Trypanosoma melophagium]|uniref:TAP46-like protein n=1 Tax=Trypanosoma melophagium TaxID=715481 RepID=UPI00351A06FD|nr:TAP46-like protein [Trypanosoma melophagium]
MASNDASGTNTTVKGHFTELIRQYKEKILNGSTSSEMDTAARNLIPQFEQLWHQMAVLGVFSPNEELDDLSTTSLELLWTPYIIADMYQRVQGQLPTPTMNSQTDISSSGITREEALACSHRWYDIFFKWTLDYELIDERTLETYRKYDADNRTQRIELSRKCRELEQEMHRNEEQVQYLQAKRKRMQALMSEDGEDIENTGGDEEEVLRNRALSRLRWSIYEACHQLQLSSRELEMLQALSPEKRQAIAMAHQNTIEAVQRGEKSLGRQTYTILPGGLIAVGGAVPTAQLNSLAMSAIANQQAFRQQVVDELMMERNKPTMTLQEFADMEMADVQRRMEAEAEAQRQQQEEDERLGADGIEERQRQRDVRMADWKDDHAPNGLTAKGNYA